MATFTGTSGKNTLAGTSGADTLIGLGGDDSYTVNHSGDQVVEALNEGIDLVNASISYSLVAHVENLTLSGTRALTGTGNDLDNVILGNTGSNFLVSGDGVDTLKGGAGDDILVLADHLTAADKLDGGTGNDILRLAGDYSSSVVFGATTLLGVERIELATGDDYDLTLNNATNAASLTIDGSLLGAADTLSVDGAAETTHSLTAIGGAGDDDLTGGGGSDLLVGGAGADKLTGGLGNDTVSYAESTAGVTVDLGSAGAQSGGDAAGDVLNGIENLVGSIYGDTFTGTAGNNKLDGGAGDDLLVAGSGNDILLGGDGDDTLQLDGHWTTADKLDGGDGLDTLELSGNYAKGMAVGSHNIERILLGNGFDYKLTLADTANLSGFTVDGSGLGNGDDLYVSGSAEKLSSLTAIGGAGNDTLIGGGGGDRLESGAGNDILTGNAGNDEFALGGDLTAADKIDGGVGFDSVLLDGDYSGGLKLAATTLKNVESIVLADGHDYELTLDNASNTAGLEVDARALGAGSSLVLDGAQETSNAFSLFGGAGVDVLTGGGGNDVLVGGDGADTMNGGGGIDTVSYAESGAAIVVDLSDPGNNAGEATGDQISNIEIIIGTRFGDTLVGNSDANQFFGGLGEDVLSGGAGNDLLIAGSGNDTFAEGGTLTALDKLDGGEGDDLLTLSASSDYASGLVFNATTLINTETIELGDGGSYKLTLNDATNTGGLLIDASTLSAPHGLTLIGSAEKESALTILGGAGDDSLTGGSWHDELEGGAGADKLVGGNGNDTASYANSSVGVTVDLARSTAQVSAGDASGDILATVENLRGSDHDDSLTGNSGANVLIGGLGADTLAGGAGNDLASYAGSAASVAVDLTLDGVAQTSTGDASGDILAADIEGVIGSDFADTLTGDAGANILDGAAGNDILTAGQGNDAIFGGAGDDEIILQGNLTAADKIDGGADFDTLTLTASAAYATGITLSPTTITNVELIELGDGNRYKLTFNDASNVDGLTLDGSQLTGTNTLYVSGAAEKSAALTVTGGAGNDTLIGGAGNDTFIGGVGADILTGGAGSDTVSYANSAAAVTVTLTLTTAQIGTGDAAGDRLSGIERVIGTDFDDTLTGDSMDNRLDGGVGDDTLNGGAGADILDGGVGIDTAVYTGSKLGVSVDLNLTGEQGGVGDAAGDRLAGIDNLTGSALGDILQGNGDDNVLNGGAGNDLLIGGVGADTLIGGSGFDTVSYVGSTGVVINLADNSQNSGGDAAGDILTDIEGVIGSNGADTLTGNALGNLLDGGAKDDELHGGDGNDTLLGGTGRDELHGGTGNDTLLGGAGNDEMFLLDAFTALDRIDGGEDHDVLTIDASAATAAGITFGTTTLNNTEELILNAGGSYKLTLNNTTNTFGRLADGNGFTVDASALGATEVLTLIASAEKESDLLVLGGSGNDVITGGGGADTLSGGAGADKLTGGGGNDTASYATAAGAVTVHLANNANNTGEAAGDILITIENLTGSGFADTLVGNSGANVLDGGLGADILDGGAGNDTASYSASASAVNVDLTNNTNNAGGTAAGDTFIGIENVLGSGFADDLRGDGGNNVLDGAKGSDTLNGEAGNDILFGQSGDDVLTAGSGNDQLFGGDGDDTFNLAENLTATDKIDGGSGADELLLAPGAAYAAGLTFGTTTVTDVELFTLADGGSYKLTFNNATNKAGAIENLSAGMTVDASALTGGNTLFLNAGAETESSLTVEGGDGNDTITSGAKRDRLFGGAGDDVLTSGGGNDLLVGGAGADKLIGGTGIDQASYEESDAAVSVNLAVLTAQAAGGHAGGDILAGIEDLVGSDFDDTLIGDKLANVLAGGQGADTLDGGAGNDTADYSASSGAVTVDLTDNANNAGGDAAGDILQNIENLIGSIGADTMTGDGNANVIDGRGGKDTLIAGYGNDILLGGLGDDSIFMGDDFTIQDKIDGGEDPGGEDIDTLHLDGNYSQGVVFAAATVLNIERIVVADGNSYNLTLNDAANEDSLEIDGAALTGGNKLIVNGASEASGSLTAKGGAGADTLIGGGGTDQLTGGGGNDTLTGNAGRDLLDGGGGDDVLTGGDGSDVLTAGAGVDILRGGDNADTLLFGAHLTSADRIDGGGGEDVLILDGDYSGGIAFGSLTMVNVESIVLRNGDSYNLTLSDANSSESLLVDGSALNGGAELILDGSAETKAALTILAGTGDDTLTGGAGNDHFTGAAGADTITGNSGIDTASYAGSAAGVTVDLNLLTAQGGAGDATGDVVTGIENLTGSAFADTLTGNTLDNVLAGGAGADTLDGGSGNDTVDYSSSAAAVTVDLGNDANNAGGDAAGDVLDSIENLTSSRFDDNLTGDSGVNVLNGGAGNDVIIALAGNDTLLGGTGDDIMTGGAGGDLINGGSGIDTVSYAGSGAVTIDLNLEAQSSGGHAAGDILIDVENVIGTSAKDRLIGNSLNNILEGGSGADVITGGGGFDTASYAGATSAVTVNLALTTGQISGGDASGDVLSEIENILGSAHADILTGDAGDNVLTGGLGADRLNGGSGVDTASYVASALGVTVNLANLAAQSSAGEAAGDILSGIENLIGSQKNDSLSGNAGPNELYGASGDDTLSGAAGNDVLMGGAGDDLLQGGAGADYIDGGDGTDTASYVGSTAGVTVTLQKSTQTSVAHAQGDILFDIENLTGSGYQDTLTGSNGDNVLEGGAGADKLEGGLGSDTASYASSITAVTVDLSDDGNNAGGDASGDVLTDIENIVGSIHGDTIVGNGGANILTGGLGGDTLDGGGGRDTASYASSAAVIVDLFDNSNNAGGEAEDDLLTSIENLLGSDFNDTLTGDTGDNTLDGAVGDDTLNGGIGADTLFGGTGDDVLAGGNDNDRLVGGLGNDQLTGGAGSDTYVWSRMEEAGDTIMDFATGVGGDQLDISDLLSGFNADSSDISDFINLVTSGADTLLQIDVNGADGGSNFVTIATLSGVTGLSASTLYDDGNIIA